MNKIDKSIRSVHIFIPSIGIYYIIYITVRFSKILTDYIILLLNLSCPYIIYVV